MIHIRLVLTRAALRTALLLTRFGRWAMPKLSLSPPPRGPSAPDLLNSATGAAAASPRPVNGERRLRLDIPFFMETDTTFITVATAGPSRPKANAARARAAGTNELLKFRSDVNRRRTLGATGSLC